MIRIRFNIQVHCPSYPAFYSFIFTRAVTDIASYETITLSINIYDDYLFLTEAVEQSPYIVIVLSVMSDTEIL